MIHIEAISNGLGSQSTFMLVLAAEGRIPATLSITADTGSEDDCLWSTGERTTAREYFEHVIEPYAREHGIEAIFVRAQDKDGNELPPIIDLLRQGNSGGVPLFGSRGGRNMQYCTGKYKIRAVRQELRRHGATSARVAIGLTMAETERMKLSDVKWCENYWPLIDLKMYRNQCQDDLDERDIPYLVSTQCDCCPHKDASRWQRTAPWVIDDLAEVEASLPGLFFTDQRIPLKEALKKFDNGQLSLLDSCDSGYCFT